MKTRIKIYVQDNYMLWKCEIKVNDISLVYSFIQGGGSLVHHSVEQYASTYSCENYP